MTMGSTSAMFFDVGLGRSFQREFASCTRPSKNSSAKRNLTDPPILTRTLVSGAAVQAAIFIVVGSSHTQDLLLPDITPSLMGLETAFTMHSNFRNYDGDICRHESGSNVRGHAVNCRRIVNSWNPTVTSAFASARAELTTQRRRPVLTQPVPR